MANLVFPVSITQGVKQGALSVNFQPTTARTQMDMGPDKVRTFDDSGSTYYQCELDLSKTETTTLESFYLNDAKKDANVFDWLHPYNLTLTTFRFYGDLVIQHIGGDRFKAVFGLEKLP